MRMKDKIGVYGSAFDPIHLGHIDCLRQVDGQYHTIIIVPSYKHAFGKDMTPFDLRLSMVETAINSISDFKSTLLISDVERKIAQDNVEKPVYTYDVLHYLEKELRNDQLEFIMGPDNAEPKQWGKFYKADEILSRWGIKVVEQRKKVRSSLVRAMVKEGNLSNNDENLIPLSVFKAIKKHCLYL